MSAVALYADAYVEELETLVHRHAPLVKRIAYHLMRRLPPSVQADDLIQSGMVGLLEATRNYDATQGTSFPAYAGVRIRGAMLDDVRRCDWAPRSLHRKMREVAEAVREIEAATGRDAKDGEIAERLGITLKEYHRIVQDGTGHRIFSVEDLAAGPESITEGMCAGPTGPLEEVEMSECKGSLAEAISELPEREQLVMALYYDEEMNLREIGAILGVSESRVCHIRGRALSRLKARMGEWREAG